MSTVHQGAIGAPNELATFRVHDAVVDFVERSVWSNTKLRRVLSKMRLRNSQVDVGQDRREKSFFSRNSGQLKKIILPNGIHRCDRSGKVWLGSSGISNFRPSSIVTEI